MTKINKPLFSLSAFGTLGKHLVFRRRGKDTVAQRLSHPVDRRSVAQLQWRTMYQKAVALWHQLSPAEKEAWERQATPLHMIGFAYFVSQALKPNPGVYLPLAGGTMAGAVDFDGHEILNLPEPTDNLEPSRKVDLATHSALPNVHVGIIPAFHVHKNNNHQSIASSTWSLVTWVTEVFDTHSDFASNKFTPTIPGYYLLNAAVRIDNIVDASRMRTALYVNGGIHAYLGQIHASQSNALQTIGPFICYANGLTDYFQLFTWQDTGANKNINGSAHSTYFQGARLVV